MFGKKKKKPVLPLNMKIMRRIAERVKFLKLKNKYIVRQKSNLDGEWNDIYSSNNITRALQRKHNAMLFVLRDFGYRPRLMERRKKRSKK